ncbi:MAG: orc1/cdc6 family replication initiation protein [Nanoarchaeota archaeon]|nr:orc1/cdc6 family replication initiation protein [Nanoarchaeota archaeon]MBU4124398.1 orc1/cdc6 family replication initiation protein [Nanoarchaeota archaeon]
MTLDDIFDKALGNNTIFKDRSVLTVSFTPTNIPHREPQISELGRILAPALRGEKPSNVFIYGRTGTGKSLVAKLVGDQIEKRATGSENPIKVIYLNCKMKSADTEYRLLASLSKEFGVIVPFTGLPTNQIYSIFLKCIETKKQNIILVIDEIDALIQKTGDEILYNLTRLNQDLKYAKITIVGITNDLSFIENLDPRIKSSLSEEELIFPPYNAIQLQEILKDRAKESFLLDILDPGVIEKCSALAAQEHGDARRALDLLRVAGELAERSGATKIKLTHVDTAEEKIDLDRTTEFVRAQPKQSQAVMWAIMKLDKRDNIDTGEIVEKYIDICRENTLKPLTQRRVSDLIAELDMFGVINTKIVSRGRYGRTRVVSINLADVAFGKMQKMLQQTFT